ncbi:hypothetical protein FJT64_010196 [Amphibalanus amphitrite]|uniref:Uncharacterized protein n=1 Tax=Amphibalanus amphitrite TaxID=1232801 RepID=A0A6A4VKA6_AMPAM|nr:hypothetical protein FJT64_010196 [Amphibalanus amphitrite]
MIAWGRIGVPAALMVLFAVPLIVIIKSRTIREEPMVLLILNMTAVLVSFNALFFVISIVDAVTANNMPHLLCSFLLSTGLAVFGGFKLSTLLLAAEQYVAVVFSLQHFTIMSRWGLKHEKRIAGDNTSRQTENFVLRFKSFRRIVKLLLIFLIIDIIGTVIHIISRCSLVVEYWAYGISNAIIPKAIKKFFGFRRNHREPQGRPADSVPPRQPPAAGPIAMIEVEANGTS